MTDTSFDPLDTIHRLTQTGMPKAQAEVHAEAYAQICQFDPDAPVTQAFLHSQLVRLRCELRSELKEEIQRAVHANEQTNK
ncbi:MAG: hypothetical protein ABJ084_10640 [Halioglobus sp.]